jgi:hypothetical protein
MKIKLSCDLYESAVAAGKVRSKSEVGAKASLSYPTVLELTSGAHGTTTYSMLGAYLEALGFTPDSLKDVRFGQIFEVE